MPSLPKEFIEEVFVHFRCQDYNPFPIPDSNWIKEFEEEDLQGTLGDPKDSSYEPTWMQEDWNSAMHSVWEFAGNHGFCDGGEWRLDRLMHEAFDDDNEHVDWNKDYLLHEYAFYRRDGGEWVGNNLTKFLRLIENICVAHDDPTLESVSFDDTYVHTSNREEYRACDFDELNEAMRNQCLMPQDGFNFTREGSDAQMTIYKHPNFDRTRFEVAGNAGSELLIGRALSRWGSDQSQFTRQGKLGIWVRQARGVRWIAEYTDDKFRQTLKEQVGFSSHELEYVQTA